MNGKTLPYKVGILREEKDKKVYWPINSRTDDEMVIGDGIPGDEKTAALCARCCNIAYEQALEDVEFLLKEKGIDVSRFLKPLKK